MNNRLLVALSAAIAVIAILTVTVMALSPVYLYRQDIGHNTVYYAADGLNANGVQKTHYIEYTPNSDVSPIIAYGSKLYGTSTINKITETVQSGGQEVIAAINGDFFETSNGLPTGIVIKDGQYISSSGGYYAVGFMNDGSAICGKPSVMMTLAGSKGSLRITAFNKMRSQSTVTLLDTNFSAYTRISSEGKNIILRRLSADPVTLNCNLALRVEAIETTSSSTPIEADQMVLTVDNRGPLSSVDFLAVGDELTLSVSANGDWPSVKYAVGGKPLLENGTVNTAGSPAGTNPRSAIGVKADGTVVLYENDGRASGISTGTSPETLAAEMQELGCVSAINLDGGGSSAMLVQLPGDEQKTVINTPSSGSLRACANYILLINNTKPSGAARHLHLYPKAKYLLKGSSTQVTVKATDYNYYPAAAPSAISYSVTGDLGTINGTGLFTAGAKAGTAVLAAASSSAQGTQYVHVFETVDKILLRNEANSKIITELSLQSGEKINLTAQPFYANLNLAAEDTVFNWSVSGNAGTIEQDGTFTAGAPLSSGQITVSYGAYNLTVPVKVSMGESKKMQTLADFESSNSFNGGEKISQAAFVHNGTSALKIAYDFSAQTTKELSCGSIPIDEGMTYLQLWYLADDSGAVLNALFTDQTGNRRSVALTGGISGRYTLLSTQIPQGAMRFDGLLLSAGSQIKGAVYVDQLMLVSKTDGNAPEVNFLTAPPANTEVGSTPTLTVKVIDDGSVPEASKISVTMDGKTLKFTQNVTTGTIAFNTPALTAGLHRITVKATDQCGNLQQKTAEFSVGERAAVFTDTSGHWAEKVINYTFDRGLLKGDVDKKGNAIFAPARTLSRTEFSVIMARYLNLTDTEAELPFVDKDKIPQWALPSVRAAYAAGIITGSAENGKLKFLGSNGITRREVMTVIGRSMERGAVTQPLTFADAATLPAWAAPHVEYLVALHVVGGYQDNTIRPLSEITRAEIAKILSGLY
ncbi:MAG: phosphodiester glycosidase family protein [Clostridia bacterium]|nr:phosphodiester glycosidase family protein [Clostridia bacterium]